MTKIIQQTVMLPAPAGSLFGMYLDPKMHGAITGSAVRVSHEAGRGQQTDRVGPCECARSRLRRREKWLGEVLLDPLAGVFTAE